jgi:hypothetical protein
MLSYFVPFGLISVAQYGLIYEAFNTDSLYHFQNTYRVLRCSPIVFFVFSDFCSSSVCPEIFGKLFDLLSLSLLHRQQVVDLLFVTYCSFYER